MTEPTKEQIEWLDFLLALYRISLLLKEYQDEPTTY